MAKIMRIGVIKSAYFLGIYGFFIGIIFVLFFLIRSLIYNEFNSSLGDPYIMSLFGFGGLLGIILVPFISGIIFFLTALIFTPITNIILKMIDGFDFKIKM